MAILTAAEARVYIRGLSGTAEDTTLDTLIGRVGGQMASYMGFPLDGAAASLELRTYTQYIDGPGGQVLRMPVYPLGTVTSVHDDPTWAYDAAHLVAASDYTVLAEFGLVILDHDSVHGSWSTGDRALKIVFTAGWSTVPSDIKHAAALQVAHLYQNRDAIGRTGVSKAGGSVSVPSLGLLDEVKESIAPYRIATGWVG